MPADGQTGEENVTPGIRQKKHFGRKGQMEVPCFVEQGMGGVVLPHVHFPRMKRNQKPNRCTVTGAAVERQVTGRAIAQQQAVIDVA